MLWQVVVPCWQTVTVTNRALSGTLPLQVGVVGPQSTTAEATLGGGLLVLLELEEELEEELDDELEEELEEELAPVLPVLAAAVEVAPPELLPPPPQAAKLAIASPASATTTARVVPPTECRLARGKTLTSLAAGPDPLSRSDSTQMISVALTFARMLFDLALKSIFDDIAPGLAGAAAPARRLRCAGCRFRTPAPVSAVPIRMS